MIEGKTPEQISKLRFADIACGSGSFLLGIYDCLLRYHTEWYNRSGHSARAKRDGCIRTDDGHWRLSLAQRRHILLNNIYGVDIDRQAVEVAQLSLFLKLLEDEGAFSRRQYQLEFARDPTLRKVLPDLSANIVCGNSLVGWDTVSTLDVTENDERELNPLDFKQAFPEIMRSGGFDVIIGNPPYLNIDDSWGKGSVKLQAIKLRYPAVYNDKTDYLYYFVARALELSRGQVSYIVSRAFLEAYKADKLRAYIVGKSRIDEIVDFRNAQIFKSVGITTCIIRLVVNARPAEIQAFRRVADYPPKQDLATELSDGSLFSHAKVRQSRLGATAWSLESAELEALNDKIDRVGMPIGKVLLLGQGMQTGLNDVFGGRTKKEIDSWRVPQGMYFKRAANTDIQQYWIIDRGEYLLFPNALDRFTDLPKGVQKHLSDNEKELKERAAYKRGNCEWWQYTWPLHADHYGRARILCPYLATNNRFAIDAHGKFLGLTDTTVLFDGDQPEDLTYFLALLNSRLMTYRFKRMAKLKSNNIYEYFWNNISRLCIRRIDFKDKKEKEMHDQLVKLAGQLGEAKAKEFGGRSAGDVELHKRKSADLLRKIDEIVYELYGLNGDEVKIVEQTA